MSSRARAAAGSTARRRCCRRDTRRRALARDRRDRGEVDELQQRVGRRLDPDHAVFGRIAASEGAERRQVDERDVQAGGAAAHPVEQPERAAVEVVHRDDVVAGCRASSSVADRRQAGGEGEAALAAFQVGDAALVGHARRVVRARVVVALVHAGARLRVGRGRVDRRHHRAGASGRASAGVDGARIPEPWSRTFIGSTLFAGGAGS